MSPQSIGTHAKATLRTSNLSIKRVVMTNILEDEIESSAFETEASGRAVRHKIPLSFRPFEIKTVKLILRT